MSAVLRTLSRICVVLLLYAVTCVPRATAQSDAIVFVRGTVLTQDPQRPIADAVALRAVALSPSALLPTSVEAPARRSGKSIYEAERLFQA